MVIREYPEEIRKLMEVYEPTKVIEAFEKVKKWAWEQGQ